MSGEDLLDQIYDWLSRKHPDGPAWHKVGFHCFRDCAPIVRAVLAMDAVEGEVSNGAWGQLLWNTYPNWREVLALAKAGYDSMHASEQSSAIDSLSARFSEYEAMCAEAMARVEQTGFDREFGEFTSIGYADVGFRPQFAFLEESLQDKRLHWLAQHHAAVQRATAT